jgi:hypothetical protein
MGASLGGAYGQTSSKATSTSDVANTYGAGQTGVQSDLGTTLSSDLAATNAGTLTPGVAAQKNAAADAINKTSSGTLDRINQFFASRGFGKSGTAGKAALGTELGREAGLGANEANFAQVQQGVNSQNLMAALQYAFQSLGQTATGASTGNTSGFSIGGGVGFGAPGKIPGI